MYKSKFYVCIGMIFLALSLYVLFSGEKEDMSNVLIVGTNPFPPYEIVHENGEWEGFDIDIAKGIAKKLGKKLVIKNMSFDSLIVALKQGKIDMIMAGMSITPSRKKEIAMIHYHGKDLTSFPLVFWNNMPEGVASIHDMKQLSNNTVCVQAGQIQVDFIGQYSDVVQVKELAEVTDLIMDIKYGKSMAAILEHEVVKTIKKKHPQLKVLDIPVGGKFQSFGHGIGIKKENVELIHQVQAIIDGFKKDGTINKFEATWFNKE